MGKCYPLWNPSNWTDFELVIRKEMQSRGTAHFHSAVHVEGAPQLNRESDQEVVAFIDSYISCAIPEEDETLKDLVTSRQIHHHTRTCKKKKNVIAGFISRNLRQKKQRFLVFLVTKTLRRKLNSLEVYLTL